MRETKELIVYTDTYENASQFRPKENSIFIFGSSSEDRADHIDSWRALANSVTFKEIHSESNISFFLKGELNPYSMRSDGDLSRFFSTPDSYDVVYLDITGLTHSVWAGLLKKAILLKLHVIVIYVEPDSYLRSSAPVEGQIYDLSSRIQGISPLPGFAVLSSRGNADFTFVPLLGFEGTRLRFMIEQVQPGQERITPVIGSPGFKPWYVFETYLGNKSALSETDAWQSARYAPANCPFSCFYLLEEISESSEAKALKIALIGTKPHALGAVLFSMSSQKPTELVHDHPIRKIGRTDGMARLLAYNVSFLFDENSGIYKRAQLTTSRRR